jgi:hypothetical protein
MNDTLWAHLGNTIHALSPLLLAALSWLSLRIAALISAKVKNERLQGILSRLDDARLDDAVFVAVREVEQVFVSMLKTASEDGSLTVEERRQAKDAALQAARQYLGPRGLAELGKVLGMREDDVDRVIGTRVESAVYGLRAQRTRVLSSVLRSALKNATPPRGEPNGAH